MEFHSIHIIYAALSICVQTENTTFSCKDNCTLTKHTRRWTYSARDFEIPLCHIPPLPGVEKIFQKPFSDMSFVMMTWQSGISKSLAEYIQRLVCFVNVQSSLHKMLSLLFVLVWTMPRISYLSCGIPFPFRALVSFPV